MGILSKLEPNRVFYYFEEICQIPHGSGNTKAISDYLVRFTAAHNLRCIQDAHNNIVIFSPGTPGYESAAPVILQGHMDMVCETAPDCAKDMTREGLDLFIGIRCRSRASCCSSILLPHKGCAAKNGSGRSIGFP